MCVAIQIVGLLALLLVFRLLLQVGLEPEVILNFPNGGHAGVKHAVYVQQAPESMLAGNWQDVQAGFRGILVGALLAGGATFAYLIWSARRIRRREEESLAQAARVATARPQHVSVNRTASKTANSASMRPSPVEPANFPMAAEPAARVTPKVKAQPTLPDMALNDLEEQLNLLPEEKRRTLWRFLTAKRPDLLEAILPRAYLDGSFAHLPAEILNAACDIVEAPHLTAYLREVGDGRLVLRKLSPRAIKKLQAACAARSIGDPNIARQKIASVVKAHAARGEINLVVLNSRAIIGAIHRK